jgi:hypothetical protein
MLAGAPAVQRLTFRLKLEPQPRVPQGSVSVEPVLLPSVPLVPCAPPLLHGGAVLPPPSYSRQQLPEYVSQAVYWGVWVLRFHRAP